MSVIHQTRIRWGLLTFFLLTIAATTVVAQTTSRQSMTTQYTRAERDNAAPGRVSQDEFDALVTTGSRDSGKRSGVQSKSGAMASMPASNNFWFYTADVVLFNDHDRDGHYYGIDLLFDVDTYFTVADVYAVLYLSLEDGPWNEYAATEIFSIHGSSSDDEFIVVTELVTGYPTGSYDILIELFDAYDDRFVASYGPYDTPELTFLPLEDSEWDTPYPPTTVVVTEGGGSLGWLSLLALLFVRRIALRRSPES